MVPEIRARAGRQQGKRRGPRAKTRIRARQDAEGELIRCEVTDPCAKVMRKPDEPTAREREAHEACHVPFRSWCLDCVSGRGVESPHRTNEEKQDEAVSLISGDYGFVRETAGMREEEDDEGEGEHRLTILAATDSHTKSVKGMIVPTKGAANPWVARRMSKWIKSPD